MHDRGVPSVDFYGNEETWPTSERLHSEPLVERSAEHDWTIRAHRHSKLTQFFLMLEGKGVATMDSVTHDCEAPAVLIVPERCVHEFEWSRDCSGFVLSITSSLTARLQRKIGRHADVFSHPATMALEDGGALLGSIFRRIHDEYSGDAPLRDLQLETLLIEMSVALARQLGDRPDSARQPGRSGRHFRRFIELVELHHKENWNVARYAGALGITAPYLNALCKRYAGRSAKRLIDDRVLLAARRGLAYTDNSVAVVARDLGFSDPSYFSRFFRRAEGLTPSEFRRQTGTQPATR
jgi:AraC family transcriptional activator of pobA